jgi:hypothetical protein
MNCCIECFQDSEICNIIDSLNKIGDCTFCGAKKIKVCPINKNSVISDYLKEIIELYCPDFNGRPLEKALFEDWSIFKISPKMIKSLIRKTYNDTTYHSINVSIPQFRDEDYLKEFGVVKDKNWQEFANSIKYDNRFHNEIFNPDAFISFLSYSVKTYLEGAQMFRARICHNKSGFSINEMGAPPFEKLRAGRINPEGITVLYLSSEMETALKEVRASVFDFVTIGNFKLKKNIKVVDLSKLATISPFLFQGKNEGDSDILIQYAVNRKVLKDISTEVAKPLRSSDSPLEYLPTQFISEFIKSQSYDGVKYASTMAENSYNLAVFDKECFICENTYVYEISKLSYEKKEVSLSQRKDISS